MASKKSGEAEEAPPKSCTVRYEQKVSQKQDPDDAGCKSHETTERYPLFRICRKYRSGSGDLALESRPIHEPNLSDHNSYSLSSLTSKPGRAPKPKHTNYLTSCTTIRAIKAQKAFAAQNICLDTPSARGRFEIIKHSSNAMQIGV